MQAGARPIDTHSKVLMSVSAACMGLLGMVLSFLPQETLAFAGMPATIAGVMFLQVTGALYVGFALLNWAARSVLIGGIYARPLALGNFAHFAVAAVTLAKGVDLQAPALLLAVTAAYVVFAVWFGLVVFTHPVRAGRG